MKLFPLLALLFFLHSQTTLSQKIPDGYILQYQQHFDGGKSLADFRFDNPATWRILNMTGNFYLQCIGLADQPLRPSLPENIALLNNKIFGDFILEIDVMPEFDTNGFFETCLFLGIKDTTRYYYIQLAGICDSVNHGIYLVKHSVISRLTGASEQPLSWKENKWHKIRVERNIVKRTILVFADDMAHPVLQAKDYELVMGSVGFGSFTSPVRFDNIKIWAPTVISDE